MFERWNDALNGTFEQANPFIVALERLEEIRHHDPRRDHRVPDARPLDHDADDISSDEYSTSGSSFSDVSEVLDNVLAEDAELEDQETT